MISPICQKLLAIENGGTQAHYCIIQHKTVDEEEREKEFSPRKKVEKWQLRKEDDLRL